MFYLWTRPGCLRSGNGDGCAQVGFSSRAYLNGTRPVNQKAGAAAVEKMEKAGVTVISQDIVTKQEDKERKSGADIHQSTELPVCTKAPEWAEHQRFTDEDEPCDDGRSGKIHQ